jgi:hypothetical protein
LGRHVGITFTAPSGAPAATSRSSPPRDGWPLWTSDVRPGREHGTNADPDLLTRISDWIGDGALADLSYEGEPDTFTIPFKKPKTGNSPPPNR